jgi:tetratricopeptide (TPR) repeat protein
MTPAKILIIALTALIAVIIFIAIANASDCGCNAEPAGGWGPPDYSNDPSWGSNAFTDGSSGTNGGTTDTGGADTNSGGTGSGSSSDSSSLSSGSSSSPNSGSADEGILWRIKGDDLFEKGLFNESLAAYENAIVNDPYAYKSWIGKGRVLLALGNSGNASEAFRKAIRLDPGNPEPYLMLGDALYAGGSYEEAVTQYHKALAMNPNLLGVVEKIAMAKNGTEVVNVTGVVPQEITAGILSSESNTTATNNFSPVTTTQTTDLPETLKASFLGVTGTLVAIGMGSLLFTLRKR